MSDLPGIIHEYAAMWPREVFNFKTEGEYGKRVMVSKKLKILEEPGVYILYRDDLPYYIGKATRLHSRLFQHARRPGSKYDLFWNFFSVFVVKQPKQRAEIEALLISALPTANGARPKLQKHPYPPEVRNVMHDMRSQRMRQNQARKIETTDT